MNFKSVPQNVVRNFFIILLTFIAFTSSFAQQAAEVEMADNMRSSGKIYVVVMVLSIVFIGIVVYLIGLDRKISKMETEIAEKK